MPSGNCLLRALWLRVQGLGSLIISPRSAVKQVPLFLYCTTQKSRERAGFPVALKPKAQTLNPKRLKSNPHRPYCSRVQLCGLTQLCVLVLAVLHVGMWWVAIIAWFFRQVGVASMKLPLGNCLRMMGFVRECAFLNDRPSLCVVVCACPCLYGF